MEDKKLRKLLKALEYYANKENWGKVEYTKYNEFFPIDEKYYWQGGPIAPWDLAEKTLKKVSDEKE